MKVLLLLLSCLTANAQFGLVGDIAEPIYWQWITESCTNEAAPTYPYVYRWNAVGCSNYSVSDPVGDYDGSSSNAGFNGFSAIDCSNLTGIKMSPGSLTNVWLAGCTNMSGTYDFRSNNIFCHTALATNYGRIFREITTNTILSNLQPDALFQGNGLFDFDGLAAIQHYNSLGIGSGIIQCDGIQWSPTNSSVVWYDDVMALQAATTLEDFIDLNFPGSNGGEPADFKVIITSYTGNDGGNSFVLYQATNLLTFIATNTPNFNTVQLPANVRMMIVTNCSAMGSAPFDTVTYNAVNVTNINLLESDSGGSLDTTTLLFNSMVYFNANGCNVDGGDGSSIDFILAGLVAAGLSNGYVDLRNNNDGGAGTQGLLDCATLVGLGWTVLADNFP